MTYDVIIVGAGIVGLSTAYKLSLAFPELRITVLEKEGEVAAHQTGNNSGVIHSGIYYQPGSYKARNCVNGRHQLVDFCRKYDVEHEICGKVIVATSEEEIPRLHKIYKRGIQNGIEGIEIIGKERLAEIEPYTGGIKAIWVPVTGIVDFKGVCEQEQALLEEAGHPVQLNEPAIGIKKNDREIVVQTPNQELKSRYLINCAGLQCDRIARSAGLKPDIQIVPFRGEYYELKPSAQHLVKGLIYPLPNPEFPFLGVHFTKMVTGGIECGPNAVFAFKREGYDKLSFDLLETVETFNFPGFWKMAGRHWRMGLDEMRRSLSKKAFVRGLQQLVPAIQEHQLEEAPSGVRAMALTPDGDIVDDFSFVTAKREIHVLNAPSPAATAGLAIGDEIVEKARRHFNLAPTQKHFARAASGV